MKKILLVFAIITILTILTIAVNATESEFTTVPFAREIFTHEETTLPYRIYVPEDYNSENKYPMVVFLHGAGERGTDNDAQLRHFIQTAFDRADGLMSKSIVIAPQCPENEQWVDTPWAKGNYFVDRVPESNELKAVVALVEKLCEDYSVDKARIYAMGVSMGGFGAWDLIIRHNDIFAGAAPICGSGDKTKAKDLVKTPIYTFHGVLDDVVPFIGTEQIVRDIQYKGGELINFVIYEDASHGIWNMAAAEEGWLEWLYSQKLTDRYPEMLPDDTEPQDTEIDTYIPEAVPDTETVETTTDTISQEVSEDTQSAYITTSNTDNAKENGSNLLIPIAISVAAVVIIAAVAIIVIKIKK